MKKNCGASCMVALKSRSRPSAAGQRVLSLIAGVFIALGLAACGGGGSADAVGASALSARQVACSYEHVYLTVERVRVRVASDEERWIEIPLPQPRQIDIAGLSGGLLQALSLEPLPAGRYTEVRLMLSTGELANAVQPGGGALVALTVPSGAQGGLKLKGDFPVAAGQGGDIVLDSFDPCVAVRQVGSANNPRYLLDPTLAARVESAAPPVAGPEQALGAQGTITPLPGGGFAAIHLDMNAATWTAQRFAADGTVAGTPVTVPLPVSADVFAFGGSVTPLAAGGFVAIWHELRVFERFGGSTHGLMALAYTAAGAPIGAPAEVDTTHPGIYWFPRPIAHPVAAALQSGGYVLAWIKFEPTVGVVLYARRFNADGTPANAAQPVATDTRGFLGAVGLAGGGDLITWEGGARAFAANDVPLGPAQALGPTWPAYPVHGGTPASLAPLAAGGAVVVWGQVSGSTFYTRALLLAPDASALAPPTIVDDSQPGLGDPGHLAPVVTGLADGGYVVVWIEAGEVHARRFAANGTPLGPETRIDQVATEPNSPAVVALAGGGFMIVWSAVGSDGVRRNYSRTFTAAGLMAAS